MKNILLFGFIIASASLKAQINSDIKGEFDKIKTQISAIQADVQSVKSQNIYLKKVLDVNTAILNVIKDDTSFSVTKVIGNRKDKTITIDLLMESKNEKKTQMLGELYAVDIEGNQYRGHSGYSSDIHADLSLNVPTKFIVVFKDIIEEPKIIKLFRFNSAIQSKTNSFEFIRSEIEFRDLNVAWQ